MARTINIAIAGLGTVGAETYRLITEESDFLKARSSANFNVVAVSAKSKDKKRDVDLTGVEWIADCRDIADIDNIDVVIELVGGSEGVAKDLVEKAITNGKSVITANKALVATHGNNIGELVAKHDVMFGYEAAVAGGIPIIKTIREGLASNRLGKIYGILNGTCNYILSVMRETGQEFEDILADAQRLGYAEADPSCDVDGVDAAQKLSILSAIAFGISPDINNLSISGIREVDVTDIIFAQELGYRIKLLASSKFDNGLVQEVSPCMISLGRQISNVEGVLNAVDLDTELAGSVMLTGYGAGAEPTATAVLSDIITVAQGKCPYVFGLSTNELSLNVDAGEKENYRYYFRLNVIDKSGVLAGVTEIFRKYSLSIESLIQRGRNPNEEVPVIITTHETDFNTLQSVMEDLSKSEELLNKPVCMKII